MNLADTYAFTGTVSGTNGAGAYEVINSSTSTNTSTLEVTGFDNGNKHFMLVLKMEPLTDSASNHAMCQFGNDSGYYSLGHATVTEIYTNNDGTDKSQNFSAVGDDGSRLQMTRDPLTRYSADVGITNGVFYVYTNNPYEAGKYTYLGGHGDHFHSTSYSMRTHYTGVYSSNTQFKKAKFFLASGNSFSGTATLYGSLEA